MFRLLFPWRDNRTAEQRFWDWFTPHAERYRTFALNGPEQQRLLNDLERKLHHYQKGLVFQFGGDGADGSREFVISADGLREFFPAVERLVAAAPPELAPGLRVVAFRPRLPDLSGMELHFGPTTITPHDLRFTLHSIQGKIGITLYYGNLLDTHSESVQFACFLMLDSALGEYDVETKVGPVEVLPIPEGSEAVQPKPFLEIVEEFDALYMLMNEPRR